MRKWFVFVFVFVFLVCAASYAKTNDVPPESAAAIAALSEEDQAIIAGLKFSSVMVASSSTWKGKYIEGSAIVMNSGPKNEIRARLRIETRILCRNRDKVWGVIKASPKPFSLVKKGVTPFVFYFPALNSRMIEMNGGSMRSVIDSYTTIIFDGIVIYEKPAKGGAALPKEWWKNEDLVVER